MTTAALLRGLPAMAQQPSSADPSAQQQSPANPPAQAQQPPRVNGGSPQPQYPGGQRPPEKQKRGQAQGGTSNDRLFYTLPNFLTLENAGQVPPLTTGQKFKVVARGSFDPVEFAFVGGLAGISHAQNSEPAFGQGAQGYAKRYGAYFADTVDENFFTGAILPSLLKQDPRYFQLGKGGFWHRTGYAISRVCVIRTDSGKSQFNYSEVFGSAIAAGISTSYHPASDRSFGNTMNIWGTQVGSDALGFVVREFWPDIRRKLRKEPAAANQP
jgi:hypothetical protein